MLKTIEKVIETAIVIVCCPSGLLITALGIVSMDAWITALGGLLLAGGTYSVTCLMFDDTRPLASE